ncbi:hypothetical protein [Actinokineospora iranica]|uniref:Diacylglycerol O-acyltransferase n=1 Tax=Actinokineospora iranica TaxID=1271860 RepID=A0A1G6VVB7_9PSEU|nr:hypothetical protein [Actinokineospora iranica]SDD57539.1 hypothetical protein SAMN05216174_113117 [Actinokineospora iranica]
MTSASTRPPGPLDLMFHQAAVAPSHSGASANVGAVLHLSGAAPDIAALRAHVADRLPRIPGLAHFLTGPPGAVRWATGRSDPGVHVVDHPLPEGAGCLEAAVHHLRFTELPPDAPPWRLWLLRGHAPGGYALFYLTQHDVQDAGAIVAVLEGLFGPEPLVESSAVTPALTAPQPVAAVEFAAALDQVWQSTRGHGVWGWPRHPLSGERAVRWKTVPADLLRAIGAAFGASVNDVHLAALGHAVAQWAGAHWPPADGVPLPIMVPLNLRAAEERDLPGNRFFLGRVTVPGGLSTTPLRRLARTVTATAPLKAPGNRVALRRVLDALPRPALDLVTTLGAAPDRQSVVGSIFALRQPLRLGRDPVRQVDPLICCPDGFPMTVALFQYADAASVCFQVDRALPHADTIPDRWRQALTEMAADLGLPETGEPATAAEAATPPSGVTRP